MFESIPTWQVHDTTELNCAFNIEVDMSQGIHELSKSLEREYWKSAESVKKYGKV